MLACGIRQSSVPLQSLALHICPQFIPLTPKPSGRLIGQPIQTEEAPVEHHNAPARIKHHHPLRQQAGQQNQWLSPQVRVERITQSAEQLSISLLMLGQGLVRIKRNRRQKGRGHNQRHPTISGREAVRNP
ncbi:hypothetical protein BEN47_18130 [Hymenobacter lapidarius]|uniref:Uncharacterized protein n=1 Tax=Hymenobacter lapidarius TaxID=1908237 RepID=A0A1G1SW21_9BACT|nr:hypothetical protein BEN47_18130 [Hymenobacter lapidarius]